MAEAGGRVDWLIAGLGNPGPKYERTRHNVGFDVIAALMPSAGTCRAPSASGRASTPRAAPGPGGPRVGLLAPLTFMNEAGDSVGPARGALGLELERVVAVHDEIDLPFGRIESRLGGGLAGHNGLKSLKRGLGSPDFHRIRVGVGRPDTTDPEIVSAYVLGRFSEPEGRGRGRSWRPRRTRSSASSPHQQSPADQVAHRDRHQVVGVGGVQLGDRGGQSRHGVGRGGAALQPDQHAAAAGLSSPFTPALSASTTRTSSSPYSPSVVQPAR